jgi:hypothetical protein
MTGPASDPSSAPAMNLAEITTRWSSLQDPVKFVMRYSPAIRAYLGVLIRQPQDAEDVAQDFLMGFMERGLPRATPDRGRFRDYLKVAVRHAALAHLRKKKRPQVDLAAVAEPADVNETEADARWLADWRQCVLDKTWRALDAHQRQNPGNYAHTILKASIHYAHEDSARIAERVSQAVGHVLSPEAYRKQLSRARKLFGETLLAEVTQTVDNPTRERVEAELADLELLSLLRKYLPEE